MVAHMLMTRCLQFTRWLVLTIVGLALLGGTAEASQANQTLVDEFTQGDQAPNGWKLSSGNGRWIDRQWLQVTGGGNDSNFWRYDAYPFEAGRTYRFRMRARRVRGTGGAISGPTFANRDFSGLSEKWQWFDYVFRAPESTSGAYIRVGQWHAKGDIQFDAIEICPTLPVHTEVGALQLGDGEAIRGNHYTFQPNFGGHGGNDSRPLRRATAGFNSTRWTMGPNSEVEYQFHLPGFPIESGQVRLTIGYHQRGVCTAEVSNDGKRWHAVASLDKTGSVSGAIPASLLPAETVHLRLKAKTDDASLQIHGVRFEADLDGTPAQGAGKTVFADLHQSGDRLTIEGMRLAEGATSGQSILTIEVKNNSSSATTAHLLGKLAHRGGNTVALPEQQAQLKANATTATLLVYDAMSAASMSPNQSQSSPTTPPGETMTYMMVVQGRKMTPSMGQIHQMLPPAQLRKETSQRGGWNNHQKAPKIRGPSRTRERNAQHMIHSPFRRNLTLTINKKQNNIFTSIGIERQ